MLCTLILSLAINFNQLSLTVSDRLQALMEIQWMCVFGSIKHQIAVHAFFFSLSQRLILIHSDSATFDTVHTLINTESYHISNGYIILMEAQFIHSISLSTVKIINIMWMPSKKTSFSHFVWIHRDLFELKSIRTESFGAELCKLPQSMNINTCIHVGT